MLINIFSKDRKFSQTENRVLEQQPLLSVKEILNGDFTRDYEKYICDQFAIRDFWIGLHSDMMLTLGRKENNGVFYGDSDFLLQSFEKPDMKEIEEKLMDINLLADSTKGIHEYFMLVPNSVVIFKEKLPYKAQDNNPVSYLNKVKEKLNKNIIYIDVYDKLNSKKNEYIFYRTDHHWTTKGAFYAYEELADKMGFKANNEDDFEITKVTDSFYGTLYSKSGFKHIPADDIEIYTPKNKNIIRVDYRKGKIEDQLYKFDRLKEKDKYSVFLGGNYPLVKIESKLSPLDNQGKLLLIKDSYANCFVPFLTAHFNEIYMVDLRYYDEDIKDLIKDNKITSILYLYNEISFLNGD
jgi:hypothetical protein